MKRLFTQCLLVTLLSLFGITTAWAQKSVLDESFASASKPSGWTSGDYWLFDEGNAKFSAPFLDGADTLCTPFLTLEGELENKPSIAITYSLALNSGVVNELKVLYRESANAAWSEWKTFAEATDGQVYVKDVLPDGLKTVQVAIAGAYKTGGETRVYRLAVENKTEAANAPTGLKTEDLTTNSVTLWWDVCSSPMFKQYNLKVSTSKMSDMSAEADVLDRVGWDLDNEFYELADLTPNTEYWFYVQYDCGDGDLSPWAESSFRTPCEAISGAFAEDFEGAFSTCYTVIEGGDEAAVSGEYAYNSQKSFKSYSGKGKYNYLILPEFSGDVKEFQVAFAAASADGGNTYSRTVIVGVCTEANAESFNAVKTLDLPKGRIWESIIVSLKGYKSTGKYIAFRFGNEEKENRIFIDNIHIQAAEECPKPMFAQATEITPNSAKLSWVETGNANEWNFVISTNPLADPEDIEPDAAKGEFAGSISANPYTATNLQPNTTYYAYLQAGCGSSEWTNALEFKTSKEVSYPYSEHFDRMDPDAYTDNNNAVPDGWVMDNRCVNPDYCFDLYYNDSYLPYVSTAQNNEATAYVKASLLLRGTGKSANAYYSSIAMLPAMPKAVKGMTVSFWAMSTNGAQTVVVAVANTQTADLAQGKQLGANITKVGTVEVPGTSTWAKYNVNLKTYAGEGRYITFYLEPGTGTPSVFIDEISIDDTPDCNAVTGLSAVADGTTKANISWTDATSATSWKVKVSTTEIDPSAADGDIANATVSAKSYTASGLSMGTKYYIYVSPACGDFWESASVTTGVGIEVPYYNDFTKEYGGTGASRGPKNWVTGLTNNAAPAASSTNRPYVYNTAWTTPPADVVKNSLRLYNGATTATGATGFPYAIMPELLNADVKDLKMSFYGYYNSTYTSSSYAAKVGGPFGQLHVGVVNSPSDIDKTNQFSKVTKIATIRCKAGKVAEKFVIDFSAYEGSGKYIVFYSDTAKTNDMMLDNLTIAKTTDPWKVSELVVSNITQTGAKLAWKENGLATQWNVKLFDAEPEIIDAATPVYSATVDAQEVTFSDLEHSTKYFAYVQSTQASGVSEWVSTSFWTETGIWTLPFAENFNGYAATSSYRSLPEYYYLTSPVGVYTYVYNLNGENFLKQQGTSSVKTNIFALPPFDKPVNTLQMTFVAKPDGTTQSAIDQSYTEIGVLEDNLSFTPVYSFTVSSYEWEEQYVNFQSYEGTGKRIAIRSDYTKFNKASGIRIDNIEVKEMGDCGRLLGVEVTEIDSISAKLSWVKSKTETKWNLKVSTSELTDPENETADFFDGQVDAQTKTLLGLEGNTNYYVYIQTVDEDKSCVGDWSNATIFKTLCKLQTFPYSEDFDGYETTGAGSLPDCANLCGEDEDHSYITTKSGVSGKVLRVGQKTKDHKNYFVFPALRTDDVRKLQLSMQVYAYNTNASYATYENYYEVGIMTDPTKSTTFVSLYTDMLDGAQTTAFDRVFKFDTYQGDESGTKFGGYIAIRALNYKNTKSNTEGAGTILVDNVTIDFIETCAKPTDLAVDSIGSFGAKLIWKTDDKTAAHRVRLFTSPDVDPSTDAFAAETVVNDSVAVVENISANTVYYAFVRKECAANDVSKWSSAYMLHTNCAPAQAMPYEEGFEACTASQAPDCWTSLLLNGSGAKAQIVTSEDYVFSGTKAMSVNKSYSQSGQYSVTTGLAAAVTPALDIESPKDVLIYFDVKSGTNTHNQISLRVEAVSDETANADAINITTVGDITQTWKKAYIKVADYYTSAQSYKRFRFTPQTTATNSGATVYIDNIVFTKDLNAVLPVSELKVKKVDVDSLTFSFLENTPGVNAWKVAYVAAGGDIADATIKDVTETTVTIKGLTANTSYDIYVRSEKTDWVGPLTASTVQVAISIPYSTGWEDNDENAMWNLYNVKTVQGAFYHNFFIVGDAAKCAGNGDKALFITNDSANYMSYGTNAKTPDGDIATSYSWATRNIRIPSAGSYKFSFKLKQPGNTLYDNDAAYVHLLPVGSTFKAGNITLPNGGTRMGTATSDAVSSGCYVLVGKTREVNDWTWTSRIVDIEEPGIYTLAIYWTNASAPSAAPTAIPLAVDSVMVDEYLCTTPKDFGYAARGAHEVKIKWLAGSCKNFEYVVSRYKNLGQPNLIDAEDKIASGTISDGPQVTISELKDNTDYSLYVRTICPDGYTDWIEHRFTTACELEDLPYTENFAEKPECWVITGNSTVTSVSYKTDGWTDSEKWKCLQLNNTCYAVLPELSVPLTKVQLELGAFLATAGAEVSVGVMDNTYDFSTFKEVAVVAPVKGSGTYSPLKTFAKMFNLYQGTGKHLALRNISGQPIYIKYVTLTELADCVQPQQVEITYVKENEATVNWLAGVEDKWEIKLNDGEPFEVNENPYVLTNLEHGTDYTVAVRALCDAEHTSEWSQTIPFTTICGVNAMPLIEDFSGLVKEKQAKIQCWENKVSEQPITEAFKGNATLVNAPQSMSYNYTWTANSGSALGDQHQLRSWDYAPTSFSTYKYRWFISPQYEIEGHAVFSFDARMCNANGGKPKATSAKFYVAVSTDNGATWKKENAKNYTDQLDTVYNTYTIDLDKYVGQAIRVAFYHEGLTASGYAYILVDNVRMNCTDTYPYTDNACQGVGYEGYGFNIAPEDLPIFGKDSTYKRFAANKGAGCDSTVTLTLTTRKAAETTPVYASICQGEVYKFGGQDLTKPNPEGQPYYLRGETQYGCDSTIYLYLTVNPSDTTYMDPVEVKASQLPYEVDNNYTIPAGTSAGSFVQVVKLDGCNFNSYPVTILDEPSGIININEDIDYIEVYDLLGRKIHTIRRDEDMKNVVPTGVYMLHIVMKDGQAVNSKVTLQ